MEIIFSLKEKGYVLSGSLIVSHCPTGWVQDNYYRLRPGGGVPNSVMRCQTMKISNSEVAGSYYSWSGLYITRIC